MEPKKSKNNALGLAAGAVGVAANIVLASAKIAVGVMTGLVSVVADGFNNVSDCGSGLVSVFSIRLADKPADSEHPFGHRRAEYVATMIIGFVVLFLAVELMRESVVRIVEGGLRGGNVVVYSVLAASVAVKAAMAGLYFYASKKTGSDTLRAAGIDSLCDCIATASVIVGALLADNCALPADGWAGSAVALFVLWQGVLLLKDAASKLLGRAPDPALVSEVKNYLLSAKGVLGVHDLKLYPYGRGVYFATVHVEMDASEPALTSHAVLDGLERGVKDKFNIALTAHLDPVDLSDGEARNLEERVRTAVSGVAEGLGVHDFRLIRGAKTKLVFDVSAPYSCPLSDSEIKSNIAYVLAFLNENGATVSDSFSAADSEEKPETGEGTEAGEGMEAGEGIEIVITVDRV